MLVKDWMSSPVVTVDSNDSLQRAGNLMAENEIDLLPVLDGSKLVGILTDRDLKRVAPSSIQYLELRDVLYRMTQVKVETAMTKHPVTVHPDFIVEEVAQLLRERQLSGCPVVDHDGRLVGVITRDDLFRAMLTVSGMPKRGMQFGFLLGDRPGAVKEITDVIRKYNCRLIGIASTYEKAPTGFRYVFVRAFNVNRERLPFLKKELSGLAKLLYVVDLRDGTREIDAVS